MLNKIRRILPHVAILICNMYIVFFLIDRVNSAMNFIDNNLTKGLLLILCAVGLFNFREVLLMERSARRQSAPRTRQRPVYEESRGTRSADDDERYGYASSRSSSSRGASARRGDYGYGASEGYRSSGGYRSSEGYRGSENYRGGTSARRYSGDSRQVSRGYARESDARSRRY